MIVVTQSDLVIVSNRPNVGGIVDILESVQTLLDLVKVLHNLSS